VSESVTEHQGYFTLPRVLAGEYLQGVLACEYSWQVPFALTRVNSRREIVYASFLLLHVLLSCVCSSVGWYHRLCAMVITVKKYRGTRYYRDGTFAITSTDRPTGIAGKFRGWGGYGDSAPKFDVVM